MGKAIKLSALSWTLLLMIVAGLIYFIKESFVARQAKNVLALYEEAEFCQTHDGCRQLIPARVVKSQTVKFERTFGNRYGGSNLSRAQSVVCQLQVKLASSKSYSVTLLVNFDVQKYDFDISNVVTLFWDRGLQDVSKSNFPENSIVYIELWREKVTFIFSNYISQSSYRVDSTAPIPLQSVTLGEIEEKGFLGVPTVAHPLVDYVLSDGDIRGVFNFLTLLAILFLGVVVLDNRS